MRPLRIALSFVVAFLLVSGSLWFALRDQKVLQGEYLAKARLADIARQDARNRQADATRVSGSVDYISDLVARYTNRNIGIQFLYNPSLFSAPVAEAVTQMPSSDGNARPLYRITLNRRIDTSIPQEIVMLVSSGSAGALSSWEAAVRASQATSHSSMRIVKTLATVSGNSGVVVEIRDSKNFDAAWVPRRYVTGLLVNNLFIEISGNYSPMEDEFVNLSTSLRTI